MNDRRQLLRVVRTVRRRWRLRVLLRGAALLVLSGGAVLLAAGYAVDAAHFDGAAVDGARVLAWLVFALALLRLVLWPLLRRVPDERVALYLEEREPTLGGRVLAAVELGGDDRGGASAALVERLVRSAVDECRRVEGGRRVERMGLWRSSGLVAGSTAFGLGLFLLGPAFLHRTAPVLLAPWQEADLHNPYRIGVLPGDATLARGSDLEVTATLEGFDAADAELNLRSGDGEWRRWSMLRQTGGDAGVFRLMVFDLREAREYFVEASGVRSPTYRIEVVDLPYVEDIHLTYHFPAYTGLDPVEQPGSGDVAALVGTEVRLRVTPTLPVASGALELGGEGGETLPLAVDEDGVLTGSITVGEPGTYRILLDGPHGRRAASPDYLIDPLADQPPTLTLGRPGRDLKVTSLEEVTVEVRAEDDYGVDRVELVYALGGGEERTASLYRGRPPGRQRFAGTHTLFLEEFELQPGDLISYYARARDAWDGDPPHEAVSDIYFLEIRPFDRNFRQADQGGEPGTGGMSGGELTARQRMILAATFKLTHVRGSRSQEPGDDLETVALSQGQLRQQVTGLVEQLASHGALPVGDSPVAAMIELLPRAAAAMAEAEEVLGERRPGAALAPEQRALQALQRAEAAFRDLQVTRGQGGGGGSGEISDELADLFELELDRLRNQYETVQRGEKDRADQAIDETLARLRQLARRQQQENERRRARARQGEEGRAGTSGDSQRRLAEEAEEIARRLERLARKESLPDLAETARRLRRAAEEMRRAAAASERAGEALGSSALEALRQARRQLEGDLSGRLARDTRDSLERARRLRRQQQRMVERVDRLTSDPERDDLPGLLEAKERMGDEVGVLEADLDRLAGVARRDQPEASRRLREAAAGIRERKIRDKILYSRGVVQQRSRSYAGNFERHIEATLGELEERLAAAEAAIGDSRESRLERALEETREVVIGLESLADRLRSADGEPGAAGPPEPLHTERELGERRARLEELRSRLGREEVDAAELDPVIGRLRDLGSRLRGGGATRAATLAVLERDVVPGLKEFEYGLRRSLGGTGEGRPLVISDDEVPEGYEEMVAEYFRALAEAAR